MDIKYKIEVSIPEIETIIQALRILNNQILNEIYMSERDVRKATSLLKESVCYQLIQTFEKLGNSIYEVAL